MKIYDCFMYNNEKLILDLRLNHLNEYAEKFIIVESKYDHQGKIKKEFFNIDEFSNFKKKIIHLFIDEFPKNISNWERESYQRNFILNALNDISDEDYIMISDVDEIPNLKNLDNVTRYKYTAFLQKNFCYKFNLINKTFPIWHGTKMCKKKYLKSPQWLRKQKVKKISFINFLKIRWNMVDNGGWHFSFLMTPDKIQNKIKSYAHAEFNTEIFTNLENIENKVKNNKDIFNRDQYYEKVEIDHTYPLYIKRNLESLKDWIL